MHYTLVFMLNVYLAILPMEANLLNLTTNALTVIIIRHNYM